MQVNKRTLKNH